MFYCGTIDPIERRARYTVKGYGRQRFWLKGFYMVYDNEGAPFTDVNYVIAVASGEDFEQTFPIEDLTLMEDE